MLHKRTLPLSPISPPHTIPEWNTQNYITDAAAVASSAFALAASAAASNYANAFKRIAFFFAQKLGQI